MNVVIKLGEDNNLCQLELQQQQCQAEGWLLEGSHSKSKHQGNLRNFNDVDISAHRFVQGWSTKY